MTWIFTLIPRMHSISPKFMNKSQTGDMRLLSMGLYSMTSILQLFFLNSVSLFNKCSRFWSCCLPWGGDLLKATIHDQERQVVTIHVGHNRKLFSSAQNLFTFFEPMPDGAHYSFGSQARWNAREHLLCFTIFLLGGFVVDLMCIPFEFDQEIINGILDATWSRY